MPTYTVSCVKRTTGKPYTIDINAKTPTDAERMALDTDHIVERVGLANDPLFADPPARPAPTTEQLQNAAILAELQQMRAMQAQAQKSRGDTYVLIVGVLLIGLGFIFPPLWIFTAALLIYLAIKWTIKLIWRGARAVVR